MKKHPIQKLRPLLLLVTALALTVGCSPFVGNPSLTLLTRDLTTNSDNLELIGGVDEETDTSMQVLLFLKGRGPTHEGPLGRLLEKHKADVILDAEIKTTVYPLYLIMLTRSSVKGQPARFVKGGGK